MKFRGRELVVAVLGAGNIGPFIALFFAQKSVRVVLRDIDAAALTRAEAAIRGVVRKNVEAVMANITFTTDLEVLVGADPSLVIEAVTENVDRKRAVFQEIGNRLPRAVLGSNSSYNSVRQFDTDVPNPSRVLNIHFFGPANFNPGLELAAGTSTDPTLIADLERLFFALAKQALIVGSEPGFAFNRLFVPMCMVAFELCKKYGLTTKELDAITMEVLGGRIGFFGALNLTGGDLLTAEGIELFAKAYPAWAEFFKVPEELARVVAALKNGNPRVDWDVPKRDEVVKIDETVSAKVEEELLGAFYGLCGWLLDTKTCEASQLEIGIPASLDRSRPSELVRFHGMPRLAALVQKYAAAHPGFQVPKDLEAGQTTYVALTRRDNFRHRRVEGGVVLEISNPDAMNSLRPEMYDDLLAILGNMQGEANWVVITGWGPTFSAGADVHHFAKILEGDGRQSEGKKISARGQGVARKIYELWTNGVPVVAAINGLAVGGGLEIAAACQARVGLASAQIGSPEVKLGILPGAGATVFLPRVTAPAAAMAFMRRGRIEPVTSHFGKQFCPEVVEGPEELLPRAIERAKALTAVQPSDRPLLDTPVTFPTEGMPPHDENLGTSSAVDALLLSCCKEGFSGGIEAAFGAEQRFFGEVCMTDDARIGIKAHLARQPPVWLNS